MKTLILIAGILVSQMAFAAGPECILAVDDIHADSTDTMVRKGFTAVDRSQTNKNAEPTYDKSGIFEFYKSTLNDGDYAVISIGNTFALVQRIYGQVTVRASLRGRWLEEAVKSFPDCKDL